MDTRTSHLDDYLMEKLENAFAQESPQDFDHDVAKIASEYSAIDLAYAVVCIPAGSRHVVYEHLGDSDDRTHFLINADSTTRSAVLRQIEEVDIAELVGRMPADEAVDVLDELPERRRRRVFEHLEFEKAKRIRELQRHRKNTAGRLMTNEYFAFSGDVSMAEVRDKIRNNPAIEFTRQVFVTDEIGKLQGVVPSRNLIINPPTQQLRQVMRSVTHKVSPDATREEIVDLVERYKIPALPVIDSNGRLAGVVTYEDVIEVMEDIADEAIGRLAGTAEDVSEHQPVWRRFLARAPWLLVTLIAGLLSERLMSYYSIRVVPFVLHFVPLITGMSGNVGIQCSTVLVRSMATGELSSGGRMEALVKELTLGLMTATVFGLISGSTIYMANHFEFYREEYDPYVVGTIVTTGVFGACISASFLGTVAPFFFARIGIDPAVASGPIITALNDVTSTLMYFVVVTVVTALLFV
ncbi:MAG: magnesium transporter [Waddliaceae bacterium]|nr:magnesium transporter [Waddliaceae bacterium]